MNFFDSIGPTSIVVREQRPRVVPIKCTHCGHESGLEREVACDTEIRCERCGELSEFRQYREAWCEAQRATLTDACPEIHFPRDRLTREYR
jgi:DNA-directed RNA polymerase subunit RPC12/RpoP